MVDLSPGRYVADTFNDIYVVDSMTDDHLYVTWVTPDTRHNTTVFPVDWTCDDRQSCLLEVALLGGEVL